MTTLADCINATADSVAVIVPGSSAVEVTYKELNNHIKNFQEKLAALGIKESASVSIALPNSLSFIVAFLATTWQRATAAPLNPAYKQGVSSILAMSRVQLTICRNSASISLILNQLCC